MGSPSHRYSDLLADLRSEFPRFRLVRKDQSLLQQAIHYGLLLITLGGMRRYLSCYQTTIGQTIYVTADWDQTDADERWITLCHERVHLRQFRRYTFVGMAFMYLFLPLPMGLAYFRARFEMEAYEETIRAAAHVHGAQHVRVAEFRQRIVRQFLGPCYGWMWPFRGRLEAWYDGVIASLAQPSCPDGPDSPLSGQQARADARTGAQGA